MPPRFIREFRIDADDAACEVLQLTLDLLAEVSYVDVTGMIKRTAGVMKRTTSMASVTAQRHHRPAEVSGRTVAIAVTAERSKREAWRAAGETSESPFAT